MDHKVFVKHSLAVAAVLLCSASWADDSDILIVGPSGRSSIALTNSYSDYRADEIFRPTSQKYGDIHDTNDSLAVSGIYAVNERINISASLPWRVSGHDNYTFFDTSQSYSHHGLGEGLAASVVLIDNNGQQGFRLVGNVGESKAAESNPVYYIAIQPEYRFSGNWLLTANLGEQHQVSYVTSQYANLNLLWRATSQLHFVSSVGITHYPGHDYFSGYEYRSIGLSATYHIDHDWAVSGGVSRGTDTERTTTYWANDIENGREPSVNIGLRRYF